MLGNYGIHTGVFPSAHVAGAFATALGMRQALPERKRVFRCLLAIAALIAIATVYGRYHYSVDAAAGFSIALTVATVRHFGLLRKSAATRTDVLRNEIQHA